MSIEIKTKKIIVRGEQKRKITEIKALSYTDLPAEYTATGTEFTHLHSNDNDLSFFNPDKSKTDHNGGGFYLEKHEVLTDEKFRECLINIHRCGNRLQKINARLAKKNAAWHGEETFVI